MSDPAAKRTSPSRRPEGSHRRQEDPDRAARHVSPRGDEFQVVGRAPQVRRGGAPSIAAEAREELLVVKNGGIFVCARPDGDIRPARVTGEGLYAQDTRYLSELRLLLGGTPPVLLSYGVETGYRAVVNATNATLPGDGRTAVPQQTVNIQRVLVIGDRLYHLVRLRSFLREPITTTLDVSLSADFADVFEVRGAEHRATRGHALAPKRGPRGLSLAYVGDDDELRETVVEVDATPDEVSLEAERARVSWEVTLGPGAETTLLLTAEPSLGGSRRPRRRLSTSLDRLHRAARDWEASCTTIKTDNELFDTFIEASVRDLHALMTARAGRRDRRGGNSLVRGAVRPRLAADAHARR